MVFHCVYNDTLTIVRRLSVIYFGLSTFSNSIGSFVAVGSSAVIFISIQFLIQVCFEAIMPFQPTLRPKWFSQFYFNFYQPKNIFSPMSSNFDLSYIRSEHNLLDRNKIDRRAKCLHQRSSKVISFERYRADTHTYRQTHMHNRPICSTRPINRSVKPTPSKINTGSLPH